MKKPTPSYGISDAAVAAVPIAVILILNVSLGANFHLAQAQLQDVQQQQYTDAENGFRVQVPAGWISVNLLESSGADLDEDARLDVLNALRYATEGIADFCPQNTAETVIGGGYDCPIMPSPMTIQVRKYNFETDRAIALANVIESGGNITTRDLWAFERGDEQTRRADVTVTSEIDGTTNLTDADTGEILATNIPTKIVEYTSKALGAQPSWPPDRTDLRMFVVYNDPEDEAEVTAFEIIVATIDRENKVLTPPGTLMQRPEVRQIFDSFEVLTQ